jgi:hypothetical protein
VPGGDACMLLCLPGRGGAPPVRPCVAHGVGRTALSSSSASPRCRGPQLFLGARLLASRGVLICRPAGGLHQPIQYAFVAIASLLRVVSARLILFIVSAGFLGRRSGCSVPGLRRRAASYFWLERHRSYLFIRRPSRGDACVEWIQILGHRYCRLHRY